MGTPYQLETPMPGGHRAGKLTSDHVHHWLLGSPNGSAFIHAVCRDCGAERDFPADPPLVISGKGRPRPRTVRPNVLL